MPPLKPWNAIDVMKSDLFVTLALLSSLALPTTAPPAWGDSSSSSGSSSSSSSSSGSSSASWDEFMSQCQWNAAATQWGYACLIAAAEPYSREQVAYKVGPERYSFARLERDYGSRGDASCKSAFRFKLQDLRRLHAAMNFQDDKIDTGTRSSPARRPSWSC